ncbi:anoctamin-5-like [Rhopalosiphum maidis]|uniref:anoctamin-5-like n=1 Tax=Rhopalosiphum maidis TaxID=43146 RepID=UPI000EFDBDC7|nr:anoctamin-5-like [Rhopalosiphum maidis]
MPPDDDDESARDRRNRSPPIPPPPTTRKAAAASFELQLKRAASRLGARVVGRLQKTIGEDRDDLSPPTAVPGTTTANEKQHNTAADVEFRIPSPPLPPSPMPNEQIENRNSSIKMHVERRTLNTVDFVLAYKRQRNIAENDSKLDDETERRKFYNELQAHGILVNVDDDPTCSLDAGRTCFALLQLSQRLLRCNCRCHTTNSSNSGEDKQNVFNSKDVNYQQYPNGNGNHEKHNEKLTSAQRAQIVWHILLQIGSGNQQDVNVMSLEQLLETDIISAAYPIHDGSIKLEKGEDVNNINDRRVLYEKWARPGLIIPRQWKSDENITALIRKYYGIPVAVYFCWLRYYTIWLVGPAIAGLVWFLYGLITTRSDVPTHDICNPKSQVADWILCPTRRCNISFCGFTRVLDTCGLYRWTSAATFDRPGAVVFAVFMSFWATAFQQLWATYARQMNERRDGETRTAFECCTDCSRSSAEKAPPRLPTRQSPATRSSAPQSRGPRRRYPAQQPSFAVHESIVRPTTVSRPDAERRSPALSVDAVRQWWTAKLSDALRALAFFATLATVAAVPILIVVYRGRAIGWLMMAVFHQDDSGGGGQSAAAANRNDDHHRQHSFFLLNYANSGDLSSWKAVVAAACATFVQLTAIVTVHRGYSGVAEWLTKYSYRSTYNPRYQSRYTVYMSCFDSANYYSSLIYIAFFKGRFVTGHGQHVDSSSKFTHFWPISMFRSVIHHIREDVCDPAAAGTGCVPELCTQLAIIMVGKQLIDNVIELTTPLALNVWRRWRAKESRRRNKLHGKLPDTIVETLKHPKQWQLDYQLEDTGSLGLYQEYSEMVIQYGFVVMFTTAFPLAPLCALLNNVLEQRLDAYKMVAAQRRPVPSYYCTNKNYINNVVRGHMTCCDNCNKLCTWTRVLKIMSFISVLYNAFMIAFTSDLLPRYVYSQISTGTLSSLDGYVAWSLSSKRNVTEYYYGKLENIDEPETCRYRGYGADADSEHNDYRKWQVLAARLTFVVIFEHGVIASIAALTYFIRKTSSKYKIHTESNVTIPSDDRLAAGASAVNGSSVGSAAVIYATDGSLAAAHDETEEERSRAFNSDPMAEPSIMVVVDMENDDQDKWTNHEDSPPSRKRRPEDTLQDSLRFAAT